MKNLIIIFTLLITMSANAQQTGWSIQPSPTTQNLRAVSFGSPNIWIAVGDTGTILRSSDNGISWSIITSTVTDGFRGVSMRGSLGLAVGLTGRVIRTTDGGLNWIEETRPTTRDLYCVSIGDVISVLMGKEGFIFVSTDNGLTWAVHTAGTASFLFGVSVNGTNAVGVGGQGAIVMSVNGGSGWGLTILGGQLTFFYGTSFVNGTTGWAVGSNTTGNVIIKSTGSGFTWTAQTAPTTEQLFGVSFAALDTGTAVGGTGSNIHTSNGGTTWLSQTSGTTQILNGVSFANTSLGIAVGNSGTILRTTNGGTTGIQQIGNKIPDKYSLQQNYPNPFNPVTVIGYQIAVNSFVSLKIYNILGKEVATLVNENLKAGTYQVEWEGSNYASGVYYYTITAGDFADVKKMVLIK